MTKGKESGKVSKETSESVPAEKDTEMLEEDKDEVKDKDLVSEEQEIEEMDGEEETDEAGVNDQSTDVYLLPKQQLGTSDVDKEATNGNEANKVEDSENRDELQEEDPVNMEEDDDIKEDDKPEDSDHKDVEKHLNGPDPDISVDIAGQVNEKAHTENEKAADGPHDEQCLDTVSKVTENVECERVTHNGCTSGSQAGRVPTFDGSSMMDDKNLREVKEEENTNQMEMVVGDVEYVKDVSMGVESTARSQLFMFDDASEGDESGTEEEQLAFIKDLENMLREKGMEFKAPKFYGEPLNLLKLWRAVIKLGGYDKVTACKLWRQVGESFNPPKTCTTVSWTFRIFYEKALLEYERHKISGGELHIPSTVTEPVIIESPAANIQAPGSGRARRDAAARAMQGWHSQRLLGNGEVGDPLIKDKSPIPMKSREKQLKNIGGAKRKKPLPEVAIKVPRTKLTPGSSEAVVIDVGPPADWVKINVRTTKDCYEVYALVPGLLREEVRVQSDPAGRLVISGEPENADNPWGVTPFRKVVSLPSRIDPHQTSAVVTLHGQLFIRVPFEQSD